MVIKSGMVLSLYARAQACADKCRTDKQKKKRLKNNDVHLLRREHEEQLCSSESVKDFTYPAAQVNRKDGLFPLLQEEDDHESEGVRGDAAFSLAVDVTQLWRKKHFRSVLILFLTQTVKLK